LRSDKGATAATTTAARAVGPTLAKPAAPVATPSLGGSSSSAGVPAPPLLAGMGCPYGKWQPQLAASKGQGS